MAHRVRKDAAHLIFDEEIAKLLLSDKTRRDSDVLKAVNNFNPEKNSYDPSQLPKFAFGPEPGRLVDRSLRHKVPMKVSDNFYIFMFSMLNLLQCIRSCECVCLGSLRLMKTLGLSFETHKACFFASRLSLQVPLPWGLSS
jgi:hypothetical protein